MQAIEGDCKVLIAFRLNDMKIDPYIRTKGERAGEPAASLDSTLIHIGLIKIDGTKVYPTSPRKPIRRRPRTLPRPKPRTPTSLPISLSSPPSVSPKVKSRSRSRHWLLRSDPAWPFMGPCRSCYSQGEPSWQSHRRPRNRFRPSSSPANSRCVPSAARTAFTVGRLATHLGTFEVKDPELEQYPEGKYDGEFIIRYIFPKSYPVGGGMRFEIRASLDGMTLYDIDKLSRDEARSFATRTSIHLMKSWAHSLQ